MNDLAGHRRRRLRAVITAALTAGAVLTPAAGYAAADASPAPTNASASSRPVPVRVCARPAAGYAACQAVLDQNSAHSPVTRTQLAAAGLHPYTAAELIAAYHLPGAPRSGHPTVAVVDAYDDPNAEADLSVYRAGNNLPACTTANGCFRKINQRGGTAAPPPDAGWALEISLDLDMVSAICPGCHIVLVEADDPSLLNLGLAENRAAAQPGVVAISNSYGAGEFSGEAAAMHKYWDHPGIVITASTGDSGYGVSVPAAAPSVIAVGGTTLTRDASTRGWHEKAWAGAGSGCSQLIKKPAWQHDTLCPNRTVADVSAVADPDTPVAVYDTYGGLPGWVYTGGTSVSAPIIAAVYALAGNTASIEPGPYLYAHRGNLHDVRGGSNGYCGGSYLCTGVTGYDGPTGWGTPNGVGAF